MDALFLAVFRRIEARHFHGSRTPPPRLASHREPLRQEIARSAERTRGIFCAALARARGDRGMDEGAWSPMALAVLMDGPARVIISDRAMDTTFGHEETIAFVERQPTSVEG